MKWIIFLAVILANLHAQEVIDVAVRGVSDNQRDGVQKDRLEAILDAKRQACERAGLKIESTTTVENFMTVYDYVEAQAAAILLPGFQIIENGYGEDGTYSVVLIGKIKTTLPGNNDGRATFHLIVWLYEGADERVKEYQLFDRLYSWLDQAHGELSSGETAVDSWEDYLVEVSRNELLYGDRRAYAYTYRLPTGTVLYAQRTQNNLGVYAVSKTQKIRLRPNGHYIMEVAGWNAIYFKVPTEFSGTATNLPFYGIYPTEFSAIYKRP